MRDRFGIFGTVIRIRKLSLLLVVMLRIPNSWHYVSAVLMYCLPTNTLYILGHVVDRGCETTIESFIVHSRIYVIEVGSGYEGRASSILNLPK